MLRSAIGRVRPGVIGLPEVRVLCPLCGNLRIRLYALHPESAEIVGCRTCVRPTPDEQAEAWEAARNA